jgi:ribosome-associated protein
MSRIPREVRITDRVRVAGSDLRFSYARSSGPGGQHVNRTSSKVILRWNPFVSAALSETDRRLLEERLSSRLTTEGDLVLACESHRDQARNLDEVVERFVRIVRDAIRRPVPRRATSPTRSSRERRLDEKRRRSRLKHARRSLSD